jgi:hypothetical protein
MNEGSNNFLGQILRELGHPTTPVSPPLENALSNLLKPPPSGVLGAYSNKPPALSALGGLLGANPQPNALGGLFGLRPQAPAPVGLAASGLRERRVFYSFHYADVNRVNLVRQSGKIRRIDSERVKTVSDRSLWERKKSTNEEYLRSSIARNIVGTSATCVLTGEHTWERPWCRFEIAQSLFNGNGIFAVRINRLYCIGQRCYGSPGPNPLDYMAVGRDDKGRIYVYEYVDGGWYKFSKMTKQIVCWPKWLQPVSPGYVQRLSSGAPIHDYESQNGSQLLLYWANQAARAAGR